MALDSRLASVQLLAIAAQRVKQRQESQADEFPVVWLTMDLEPEDPTAEGQIYLPRKCQTAEEWYNSPLIAGMRARLRAPGGGPC